MSREAGGQASPMATRSPASASGRSAPETGESEAALGRQADTPDEIPAKGWKSVLKRTKQQVKEDNVSILSAGVAYYLLLALAPALAAVLSIYGLVREPADAAKTIGNLSSSLPADAQQLVADQLKVATGSSGGSLGLTLVVSIVLALLSASKGAKSLIATVNVAFDEEETRGFLKLRLLALGATLAAIVVFVVGITLLGALPALGDNLGRAGQLLGSIVRWPLLAALMMGSLAALYRYAPDRDEPRWSWVTPGTIVATVIWLVGSALFAVYADLAGGFTKSYGTLASVVAMMLWLFLTAFAILVGAEINAEAERQTRKDSTEGKPAPMGGRRAFAADTVAGDPPPDPAKGKGKMSAGKKKP